MVHVIETQCTNKVTETNKMHSDVKYSTNHLWIIDVANGLANSENGLIIRNAN